MSTYKLNDNVNDSFQFELGGFTYDMRYPTVEETEAIQVALRKAEEENSSEAVLQEVYKLITCEDTSAPKIQEVMPKQNIKVLQNFTNMIRVEFGGE
jgi:hypothetical protein